MATGSSFLTRLTKSRAHLRSVLGEAALDFADNFAATPPAMAQVMAAPAAIQGAGSRGVNVMATAGGEVIGFEISAVHQVYTMIDRIVGMQRVFTLPIAERYAVAGKIAAVPAEHARIAERLASNVATSQTEANALNALYLLELCKEVVPGFKDQIAEERLQKAAEMSAHKRVQAAVLRGSTPPEWEKAKAATPASQFVLMPQEDDEDDEDDGVVAEAGRAVSDVTKFVGGTALGGMGLVTDTLGFTEDAEGAWAETAEDAVDLFGGGVSTIVDAWDSGIDGTADHFAERGFVGAVGDGMEDAVDIVSDFAYDGVTAIADGVGALLNWATGEDHGEEEPPHGGHPTHKLVVQVAQLFGEERSLGLRLENRVITKFSKPEAEGLGFRLGDCIMGVGAGLVHTQEEMLAAIAPAKEALKNNGNPVRFLVERMGPAPVRR
mmetsp:Transcript_165399/g.525631  ORF Transcript_165399/g.525631 Transcript_165399/m.525631 type:complete len:437 (+) Transcript_165399:2-1312(+)